MIRKGTYPLHKVPPVSPIQAKDMLQVPWRAEQIVEEVRELVQKVLDQEPTFEEMRKSLEKILSVVESK